MSRLSCREGLVVGLKGSAATRSLALAAALRPDIVLCSRLARSFQDCRFPSGAQKDYRGVAALLGIRCRLAVNPRPAPWDHWRHELKLTGRAGAECGKRAGA